VSTDDLNEPLGQNLKIQHSAKVPLVIPQAIAGLLGLFVVVFLGWAAIVSDPLGGEPTAIVSALPSQNAPPAAASTPAASTDATPGKAIGPGRYDGPEPHAGAARGSPPGTQTITIIDGSSGKRQEIVVPGSGAAKAGSVDQRLLEASRHGQIPRIALDGARPAEAYAQKSGSAQRPDAPRIALIIGGLGISASTTADALSKLPGPVTFAFAPYGSDLESNVGRARAGGHEVLMQIPMEPFDYPDNDPGPQTLLSSLSGEQNIDRLQWLMSRFQGYVGVMNFMGARFTASEQSISPVLREVAKRGLIYVDDGASPRSLASQIAGANRTAFAKADIVVDAVPTTAEIDKALVRLESLARERGSAVAYASALPVTVERVARWSKTLAGRGVALVPISVIALKARSS